MIERLRILPVLIVASTALLGVKLGDLWEGVAAAAAAPAPGDAGDPPDRAEGAATASPDGGANADPGAESEPESQPETANRAPPSSFTKTEIEVLQSLADRRERLDARAEEQAVRENLLKAAEKRVSEKIERLKQLEARVESLIKKRDEEIEQQLMSLVKVYENMKPRDAARIFEQLEMDILIGVAERMSERKIAPILADMDPVKAKELTVELATHRNLPAMGG